MDALAFGGWPCLASEAEEELTCEEAGACEESRAGTCLEGSSGFGLWGCMKTLSLLSRWVLHLDFSLRDFSDGKLFSGPDSSLIETEPLCSLLENARGKVVL